MELPMNILPGESGNPKSILMYGPPKIGKTEVLAALTRDKNFLLIDLEVEGSDSVDARKIKVSSLKELQELGEEIIKQNKPYDGIIIDTITQLEEWCEEEATKTYMSSSVGSNFNRYKPKDLNSSNMHLKGKLKPKDEWESVLSLPMGAGYLWLRLEFKKWLDKLRKLSPYIICVAHIKDIYLDENIKTEADSKDLDLTGKVKRIACANLSNIGYLYRDSKKRNELRISFKGSSETSGSRSAHLKNQDLVLAVNNDDGTIKEHFWNNIYIK